MPIKLTSASAIGFSINELAAKISKILGKKENPSHSPSRQHEVYRSSLDNRLAKKVLDWEPKVSLDEGLKKTISSFSHHAKK